MEFHLEVIRNKTRRGHSAQAEGIDRVIEHLQPNTATIELIRDAGYDAFILGPRTHFTQQEFQSSPWYVLRMLRNHNAAATKERYDYTKACPACWRGRKLERPGICLSRLWRDPIQGLTSGELVIDLEVARLVVNSYPEAELLHPKLLVPVLPSALSVNFDATHVLVSQTGRTFAEIRNSGLRMIDSVPVCTMGHTLEPFEDGVLRVSLPKDARGICFTVQNVGYAGGLWASAPYTLVQRELGVLMMSFLKSKRAWLEPIIVE